MALKDMLKASAAKEAAQLSSSKANSSKKTAAGKPESSTSSSPAKENMKIEKHPGGRPPKAKSEKRKQYTLTLRPDTYNLFMKIAKEEDPDQSFSKFIEKATYEYIERHH